MVNIPEGIFDEEAECVTVIVEYQTLDGQRYELTQVGSQQYRQGDGRFNVVFPNPATIKALPAV